MESIFDQPESKVDQPEVIIHVRPGKIRTVEIIAKTDVQEAEGIKLYRRLKPGIVLLKQLASGGAESRGQG